jgi:biotin synthase-like enzyme
MERLSNLRPDIQANLGSRRIPALRPSSFPDAGAAVQTLTSSTRPSGSVDVMLVNPPSPDGGIWIRSQHRVGRRSRENMIWPQVSLAQLAAILTPEYSVQVVDAIAERMSWADFERLLDEKRPRYYLTQVTAPTLRNDMYGVFLAKSLGASTLAFGTCKYCIKHVTYQNSVRVCSAENIVAELKVLAELGIQNIHMYADLFTVNRTHVIELCQAILDAGLKVNWTCNSRVDYVDEEMLTLMGKAGCYLISWGIESANEEILKRARKGYKKEQAVRALGWAKAAGIKNWGYFIIGLPGETETTIQETIAYSKELPLDIALFHIAAPYPGTPFFYEVVQNNWFRPGTKWEEVDMDQSTVLDYHDGGLTAEQLEYWQKRATREWSFRPGPMVTFLKSLNSWEGLKSGLNVGWQMVQFVRG